MKNATRPPKRKLLGFAEQPGLTPVPMAPVSVGLTMSPIPTGPELAATRAHETMAAAQPGKKEMPFAPVKAGPRTPSAKSKPGGGIKKFALITIIVMAIVVAGPSLAMMIGMFAYPLIVPAAIVGGLIFFHSTLSKRK